MANKTGEELPLLSVNAAASPKSTAQPLIPKRIQGVLMVAMSALMFSILMALVKYASYSMPSMETVFWRSFVCLLLNLVAMRVNNVSLCVEREFWLPLAVRSVCGTCAMLLSFYAMQQMVLADASVLLETSSIMTFFVGAFVLKESIDPLSLFFAVFSLVGVACVSRPTFLFGTQDQDVTQTNSAFPMVCCFLSAAFVSFVYVSMRRLQQLNFMVVINYFSLTASIVSLVPLLAQGTFVLRMTPSTWFAVIGSGVFGFLGQLFLTRGFQLEKAGVASVMNYLNTAFVFVWDVVFLHEIINPWSVLGAAIILGCAATIVLRRMHKK